MNIQYPAKITYKKADKRYLVEFVDIKEAITEGETLEEALFNAAKVLTLSLDGRIDDGLEAPLPSKKGVKNIYYIACPPRITNESY